MSADTRYSVRSGFDSTHRERVVELFWGAFKEKLELVMRPEETAVRFLREVVDPAYAVSAVDGAGQLLGVAGFKTAEGAFIGGGLEELTAAYGGLGGAWRGILLALLERPIEPGTLLMDGIFVSADARGRGVGSALLDAIKSEAASRGCRHVRLDVIDTNPRAKALYERRGFVEVETAGIGPLRHVFGFRAATTMTCAVR